MSKGKTFSITIPYPLFDQIEEEAKTLDISRSKFVYNILQSHMNKPDEEEIKYPQCIKKDDLNMCSFYENKCPWKPEMVPQCSKFKAKEEEED